MHVDTCYPLKPQRPRLSQPCNNQVPPHFFFDFYQDNQNIQEILFIPTDPHKSEFLPHFTLFSLKERAKSSLKSLLSNPQVHTLKERQDSISFLLHTLSKKLENSKTLSSSLPLILSGSTTRKGKSFHTRVILLLFPLKNQKLGKVFSYSHLRIHDFFKEFLVMVFVLCEIRKS